MKIEVNVNSPFNVQDVKELQNFFKHDIYIYLGISEYIIINFGKRKYNYTKKPDIQQVIKKIEYIIKNNI